jgi:hypothetical protein
MKNKGYRNKFAIIMLVVIVSSKIYGQNLKIELFNKTLYDLDSVTIGEKFVGKIKKNSSIVVLDCKEIVMQSGLPYGFPHAIIIGKEKSTSFFGLCGTGRKKITKGKFKFDITLKETENDYRLIWSEH